MLRTAEDRGRPVGGLFHCSAFNMRSLEDCHCGVLIRQVSHITRTTNGTERLLI